jgi:hypothetical protein
LHKFEGGSMEVWLHERRFWPAILSVFLTMSIFPADGWSLEWPVWPDSTVRPISANYGVIQSWYLHSGIDIAVPEGTPVFSMTSGYVKIVMTLYEEYSSWRVVIGDSPGTGECEGWMYAHLRPYSIAVGVGDWVNAGDSIAVVVSWPGSGDVVEHLHLSKVRFAGDSAAWENGFNDWQFIANPLDFVDSVHDADIPVIEKAWGNQLFAFCRNQLASYFPEGTPLSGDIDVISSIYDYTHFYQWKNTPYIVEYKIEGDSSIPWTTSVCFDEPIGSYNSGMVDYRHVIYQDDYFCRTTFTVDSQAYFFNLTNSDGDGQVETSDLAESWQTPYFHNGQYQVFARAADKGGNVAVDSMVVTVENFFELTGTIGLETTLGDWSGTIVEILSSGTRDTTDADGQYSIMQTGGGSQAILVYHKGYGSVDTTLMMNENRALDLSLFFQFVCGDANMDNAVNILDVTFLISYLYKSGQEPDPPEVADVNSDARINILDITYLINFLYKGGPDPVCL